MKCWRIGVHVLVLVGLAVAPVAAAEQQDSDDPVVQYRRDIMKGIGANAAALGQILRSDLPQTQNFAFHAQVISLSAHAALSAFQPKVPGGSAKPEVWDKWKEFSDRLTKLAATADAVTAAARTGGPDAAKPKINDMLGLCKNCHDDFKRK